MKRISKMIKSLDFFGENVNLYINNSSSYKTITGGLYTLFTIFITIIIITLNLITFINNRTMNVYLETRILSNYSPIEITNETFKTAFHLVKNDKGMEVFRNYTLEDVDAKNSVTTTTSKSNSTYFNILNCSKTDFVNTTSEFESIKKNPLLNVYKYMLNVSKCIVLDDGKHYLGGDMIYSNNYSDFKINFTINMCPNGCDQAYFKNISNLLFFNLFSLDAYPDMKSPDGYQNFIYYYIIQNFDFTKDYLYTITYQKNLIYTDLGILYNTGYHLKEFLSIKDVSLSSFGRIVRNGKSNVFVNVILDRKENVYNRTYIKLDLLIANITAYSSIFYNIFFFLCKLINYNKLNLKLINKFFNITSEWKTNKDLSNELVKRKIRIIKYKPQQESVSKFRDELSQNYREKILKYIERKHENKIKYNFGVFNSCINRNYRYNYGEKLLHYYIDIKFIIKQLSEFNNWKTLFFDKHQLSIFNLLQPNIVIDNENIDSDFHQLMSDNFLEKYRDDESLDKRIKSLSSLINSKKDINDKILKLFRKMIQFSEE